MSRLSILGTALLTMALVTGSVQEANSQVVRYVARPVVVARYPYYYRSYYPAYPYYGRWYPGSYQNLYGNYGAYYVAPPIWTGGYVYPYW